MGFFDLAPAIKNNSWEFIEYVLDCEFNLGTEERVAEYFRSLLLNSDEGAAQTLLKFKECLDRECFLDILSLLLLQGDRDVIPSMAVFLLDHYNQECCVSFLSALLNQDKDIGLTMGHALIYYAIGEFQEQLLPPLSDSGYNGSPLDSDDSSNDQGVIGLREQFLR